MQPAEQPTDMHAEYEALKHLLVEQAERLHALEREVQHFLDQYFSAVAEEMETLQMLERSRTQWFEAHIPATQRLQRQGEQAAEQARTRLLRDAYRSAARNSHPDKGGSDGEAMRRINRAREEGDIATLVKEAMPKPHRVPEAQWQASLAEMAQWRGKLEESTRALLDSPAYALYLKAFEARLSGRNWLEEVTQTIRRQVTSEQRAIAKKNIESIAGWRVA